MTPPQVPPSPAPPSAVSSAPPSPQQGCGRAGLVRVCSAADLADDTALGVEVGGEAVCVVRSGGRVFALRDVCSHAEVMLSAGEVEDGQIECWLHGSQFDLETGRPTSLPATEPVPTYAVVVEGDDVFVGLEPADAAAPAPAPVPTTGRANAGATVRANTPTTRK